MLLTGTSECNICSNNLITPLRATLQQFAMVFAASGVGGWKLALILGKSPHLF